MKTNRKNLNYSMIRQLWYINGPSDISIKHLDEHNYGFTRKDFILLVMLMWLIGSFDFFPYTGINSLLVFISNLVKWVLSFVIGYTVSMYFVYSPDFRSIYNNTLEKEKKQEEESKNKTSN